MSFSIASVVRNCQKEAWPLSLQYGVLVSWRASAWKESPSQPYSITSQCVPVSIILPVWGTKSSPCDTYSFVSWPRACLVSPVQRGKH